MTVPMGTIHEQGDDLPAGMHFMAQRWNEDKLFAFGKVVEGLF